MFMFDRFVVSIKSMCITRKYTQSWSWWFYFVMG